MGIEVPKRFGGCEFSFMSSIIAVEGKIHKMSKHEYFYSLELAKVDPSVSIICDIHVKKA